MAAVGPDCIRVSTLSLLPLPQLLIATRNIGWKFYLCFIIPGTIGGIIIWLFFPNTKGLPLEEIAAIFGDEDEIAVYQREIDVHGGIIEDHHIDKKAVAEVEEAGDEKV